MATAAQINANIQNAQASTGPITEAGKARSSQNAVKHGLSASVLFIAGEDPAQYYALKTTLRQEHQPQGATEDYLVEQLATALWLTRRAIVLQAGALNRNTTPEAPKSLAVYMRYQTSNERGFHKALETLRKLQAERAKQRAEDNIGFALQSSPEDLVAHMADLYKKSHPGDQLAPEIIEAMLHNARQPQNSEPPPAK